MKTNTLMPVIKAILNDEEFLCGGIFTKEKQYAKKYDLTMEEIGNIQTCYIMHYISKMNVITRELIICVIERWKLNENICIRRIQHRARCLHIRRY